MYTGIDPGLKGTAIVTIDNKGNVVNEDCFGSEYSDLLKKHVNSPAQVRYRFYGTYLKTYLENNTCGTVIIEKPMGTFQGYAIKLAELYGIYLYILDEYIPTDKIFTINPTEVKKLFTGYGNAGKKQMILRCKSFDFEPGNHHIADAYAIAKVSANPKSRKYLKVP